MRHAHAISRPLAHRANRAFLRHQAAEHARPRPVARDLFAFDWAASGWAGIVAGAAFILIQTVFASLLYGSSGADSVRMIAAIALGSAALPGSTPFTAIVFLAAMGVHMILSLVYARILAVCVDGMNAARAVQTGAAFGALLYAVNFYAFTSVFPWFAASRGWITLLAHVAFGVIAAGVYEWLTVAQRNTRESPSRA